MKCDEHHLFPRELTFDYPIAVRGKGVWVSDEKGKKYLDGCSGANVTGIGHGVEEVAAVMSRQAKEIAYPPPQHFLNNPAVELAEKLIELTPECYTRVMLCSGGSEAVENALKIARQFHVYGGRESRYRVVSRWQGFHGNTLTADAVSGKTGRRKISTPMLMHVPHIVQADCYRCAFGLKYPDCGMLCARDLERIVIQEGPEYISTFICETIVGAAAGGVTPVSDYYPLIREICDTYNIVWIADEVMAGAGRTGTFLAIEQWGVYPDLVVLAKGLSSGYAPLAAILVKEEVWEVFEKTGSPYIGGHTYNAHPVTAAVGCAVLDYMKRNRLMEAVPVKGERLEKGLRSLMDRIRLIGDVRGRGLMWGLEFVRDRSTGMPFDSGMGVAMRVVRRAQEKGLIVYPVTGCADGERGDGILICPPLIINEEEIEYLLQRLEETLFEISEEIGDLP